MELYDEDIINKIEEILRLHREGRLFGFDPSFCMDILGAACRKEPLTTNQKSAVYNVYRRWVTNNNSLS